MVIDNHAETPVYYVGTNRNGVYSSDNGGITWNAYNNGLDKLKITTLKINAANPGKLYAGTLDGGVWITSLTGEIPSGLPVITNQKTEISILPNPNQGNFNIINESNTELKGNIKIVNLMGDVIYIIMFISDGITLNKKIIIEK